MDRFHRHAWDAPLTSPQIFGLLPPSGLRLLWIRVGWFPAEFRPKITGFHILAVENVTAHIWGSTPSFCSNNCPYSPQGRDVIHSFPRLIHNLGGLAASLSRQACPNMGIWRMSSKLFVKKVTKRASDNLTSRARSLEDTKGTNFVTLCLATLW
jgi:hypothetical protein